MRKPGCVIAVANQKGGAGKTTIAAHVAVQAQRAGYGPVVIIDTDPQGTLAEWYNDRVDEKNPHRIEHDVIGVSAEMHRLADQVEGLRQSAALIIIDTPPSRSPIINDVIRVADDVLIPLNASPNDIRAVGATIDIADQESKPFFFVINRAKRETKLTKKTIAHCDMVGPVAPVVIGQRDNFAAAMADGRTIMEIDRRNPGNEEVTELWAYIQGRLDSQKRKKR